MRRKKKKNNMTKQKIKEKRENKEEVTIKHCTLIEWLNSLTVPSGVAICRNLPYDGTVKAK